MKAQLTIVALAFFALSPFAHADAPGRHPGYLHALTDLRDARWNLQNRPGDGAVSGQENVALSEIERALGDVKTAARFDEKDLREVPRVDARLDRPGRLHHALDLLRQAHADLDGEEDNPAARGLKRGALEHVDRAVAATEHAIRDVEYHR
jgi:hypothetical protein